MNRLLIILILLSASAIHGAIQRLGSPITIEFTPGTNTCDTQLWISQYQSPAQPFFGFVDAGTNSAVTFSLPPGIWFISAVGLDGLGNSVTNPVPLAFQITK